MITVRIGMRELHAGAFALEAKLVQAGMPPMSDRDGGLLRRWFDAQTDTWVFEYVTREEAMR